MIKSIDTFYNGNYFRSRLEARWAVFFDLAGIYYEYEPEGYELQNREKYLPDFYLPKYECYVEVKPEHNDHTCSNIENTAVRAVQCCIESGKGMLFLLGSPTRCVMKMYKPSFSSGIPVEILNDWVKKWLSVKKSNFSFLPEAIEEDLAEVADKKRFERRTDAEKVGQMAKFDYQQNEKLSSLDHLRKILMKHETAK